MNLFVFETELMRLWKSRMKLVVISNSFDFDLVLKAGRILVLVLVVETGNWR